MIGIKNIEKTITEAILSNETVEEKRDAIKLELERLSLQDLDWSKYCFFVDGTYTRNAVIHNDDFSILVLCWSKSCKSQIHNHPCDGCFIVGLSGELEETRYEQNKEDKSLVLKERNIVRKGDIAWMHDCMGYHRVSNMSDIEDAVTLHIYHPPFNACKSYNIEGENWNCYPKFFSINGEKVEQNNEI